MGITRTIADFFFKLNKKIEHLIWFIYNILSQKNTKDNDVINIKFKIYQQYHLFVSDLSVTVTAVLSNILHLKGNNKKKQN